MNTVEKVKFLDGRDLSKLSEELFLAVASAYACQNAHNSLFDDIAEKIVELRRLYDLPGIVYCENGEPVICLDLSGKNLETILDDREEMT